jgi:hypothetical protein
MPTPIDLQALGDLIRVLNPYSTDMHLPSGPPTVPQGGGQGRDAQPIPALEQFHVEVDDYSANYSSGTWTFRGQPATIKKAIRITYRYPLLGSDDKPNGVYATEHLLIGYAGSNSG